MYRDQNSYFRTDLLDDVFFCPTPFHKHRLYKWVNWLDGLMVGQRVVQRVGQRVVLWEHQRVGQRVVQRVVQRVLLWENQRVDSLVDQKD